MLNQQRIKAIGGNQLAFINNKQNALYYDESYRQKPGYYSEVIPKLAMINPLIIAVDWPSLNFWRRHKGLALLCESLTVTYDLVCCHTKDVWVLSSNSCNMPRASELAYQSLSEGAEAACAIQLNAELIGGRHARQ